MKSLSEELISYENVSNIFEADVPLQQQLPKKEKRSSQKLLVDNKKPLPTVNIK